GKFVAINDLIKTQDGHIVVCGGYLDNGMLWAKIDQDGNLIWSQFQRSLSFGLSLSAAVELPSGRLVFAGKDTQNRKILIGASATGDFLWKKSFNHLSSVSQVPAEIQLFYQPEDGSLLLFGPDDGIYIKSDTLGNFIWSKKGDKTYHLFQLPAGGYLAISEIINRGQVTKIDNELVPTWSRVYPYQSVYFNQALLHPDGGYYAVGTSLGIDFLLPRELYLARLDWSGFAGDCMPLTYPFRTTTYSPPGYSHPLLEETVPVYIDAPPVSVDTTVANLAQLCTETCTRFNEICNNGIDDDVDGLTDCMDSDCNCPEDPCQTKRFNIWHVGKHRLDFNQNPPAVTIIENEVGPFTSTLCDLDGNLLLYSDEKNVVWNRVNYNIAPSALAGLGGQLIPNPGSLSMVLNIRNESGALIIDEIDLTMEMGLGSLDFSWLPSGSSKINRRHAITKACPSGYWIALHRPSSNHLHALLMSEDGTNPFFLFGVESEAGPILGTAPMDMKFSPNGSELVMLDPLNGLHLLQFNSKNGKFFNSRKLPDPPNEFAGTAGAFEFSPDGHYLYLTISKLGGLNNSTKLFQYDLEQPGTPVQLVKELQVFVEDISLGPDHKIYLNPLLSLSPIKYRLDVIHAPNNDGAHINYEENYIDLPVNGSPSIGKWELPVNIATNNYEPRISFYPDSPDTVCGYQTSGFNFRVKTAACFFDAVNWELQGVQGLITATEDTTLGGSKALIQFFESGTAKIIVSAVSPCGSAFDTIEVYVTDPQLLKVNLGPDIQICQNAAVVLDAGSEFVSYHWSNGSGDQVLDVSEPGKYWVDAFDQCGNKSSDTLIVSLSTESVLNLDTLTSPKCSDYSMTFQRPSFFDAWSWSPNIGINCVDCSEVTISSPQSQSWIITAQN
ncbi:MAG: hypothetical protein JNJ57_07890, partial [Saprospiraceae bacterium]|nr:hypothetical protein [Saprospiraceae bacterium]